MGFIIPFHTGGGVRFPVSATQCKGVVFAVTAELYLTPIYATFTIQYIELQ